uniref:Uncharacterized protein n=1 Tax=Meloidogyne enterolobii TaxID=390850 RepID=A0A6V7UT15_MELEN|nr:unnamed protein product [Meloidogyne enterolobii]
MDAANHSLSNDIKPQTSLILNTNQLDELTNQLKILSIDDLSINKIVENLKTIKTEPHVIDELQNFIQKNGLFGFVLNQMTNSCTFDSKNLNKANKSKQVLEEIIKINEHIKCNKKALVGTTGHLKQILLMEVTKLQNAKSRLISALQRLNDQRVTEIDQLVQDI